MSSTRSSFTRTIQTTASTIRLSIPFFLSIFCTILVWFRYVIQTLIEDTKCYRPNSNVIHFDCCNTLKINTNYLHFWEHRWITRNKKKPLSTIWLILLFSNSIFKSSSWTDTLIHTCVTCWHGHRANANWHTHKICTSLMSNGFIFYVCPIYNWNGWECASSVLRNWSRYPGIQKWATINGNEDTQKMHRIILHVKANFDRICNQIFVDTHFHILLCCIFRVRASHF